MLKFFVCIFLIPTAIFGSWYDQKLEGWYYFQDPKTHQKQVASPTTLEDAEAFVANESRKLKQLLFIAIASPTSENVENYMWAQKQWIQQSGLFAQAWGKVLLEHPELSDLIHTPTSSYGVLAKKEANLKQRKELLQKLSKDYFLLFFFKGADPFSKKAAEVAELFASTNQWKLKSVSLDNLGTSEFHNFETDKGISARFGVLVTPCFYIVNPAENQAYPVGAGMISVSEIEENIEVQLQGGEP